MVPLEQRRDRVARRSEVGFARDADVDALDVRAAAEDLPRDERERDEDAVVEVLARELPPAARNSDHVEFCVADADRLAERVLAVEQLRGRRLADHGDAPPEARVRFRDEATAQGRLVQDTRVRRRHADDERCCLEAAGGYDDALDVLVRRDPLDRRQRRDRGDVLWRDRAIRDRLLRAHADQFSVEPEDVAAEPADARADIRLGARADRLDRDQGGDADDDAERCEDRAKPVRPQRFECDPRELGEHRHWTTCKTGFRSTGESAATAPSASRTIRPVRAATSSECVTITIVVPLWCRPSRISRISSAL